MTGRPFSMISGNLPIFFRLAGDGLTRLAETPSIQLLFAGLGSHNHAERDYPNISIFDFDSDNDYNPTMLEPWPINPTKMRRGNSEPSLITRKPCPMKR